MIVLSKRQGLSVRVLAGILLAIHLVSLGGTAHAIKQSTIYGRSIYYFDQTTACGDGNDAATTSDSSTTAQQIARSFIVGFDAGTSKEVITGLAKKYHIGGMYLVGTNDAAKAGFNKTFYSQLSTAAGSKLVIASDEEGVVARYDYGGKSFPSAASLAKKSNEEVTSTVKSVSKVMADNGLTADLAPVLDLRDVGNGLNGRSFSDKPDVVSEKADAYAAGLKANGIAPVFKHFPGFDDTTSGSTDDQKVIMKGSINDTIKPYKTLLTKYPTAGLMLSNMYVNKLDTDNPSSMSAATVKYIRSNLNFEGMITTDDLGVKSVINKSGSLANAVADSLQAGVTMPLFTLNAASTSEAEENINKIISAVQSNSAAMDKLNGNIPIINSFKGGEQPKDDKTQTASASCCGASGGGTTLSGSDNQTKAFNYFLGKGLNAAAAAGIVGNLQQESGVNPDNPSSGGGTIGIAQWEGDRDDKLKELAAQEKKPYTDLGVQLDYLWKELNGGYKKVLESLQKTTSYEDATNIFVGPNKFPSGEKAAPTDEVRRQDGFENPGTPVMSNRLKYAKQLFEKSGGNTSASPTASNSSCNSGVSPDCAAAQGSAKILCAAKAYDTTSYQFGAGPRNGKAWHKQCPTIGPSCSVDCSLLVTLAVYDAFDITLPGTDTGGERADIGKYWEKVTSLTQVQPGDIMQPEEGHVEIVDHVEGKTIYTFGAHTDSYPQPKQVSPAVYKYNSGMLFLHLKGADK